MRLPRFRIRTLMVAVAIAALAIGSWAIVERRRGRFLQIASYHKDRSVSIRAVDYLGMSDEAQTQWTDIENWHIQMTEKYEKAARIPWLPVGTDPPPPHVSQKVRALRDWLRDNLGDAPYPLP